MRAYYERDGDLYVSSGFTRGPWNPAEQHAGPPSALLGGAIEALPAGEGEWRVARFTLEILRAVPVAPLRVQARTLRPGRRVQQAEATMQTADGTEIARATAWRIRAGDGTLPEINLEPVSLPAPGSLQSLAMPEGESYFASMDWRFASGVFFEPGPAAAWMRLRVPVVAGEEPSPLQRVLAAADSANGISMELDMRTHIFVNVDLTVHLARPPAGEWVCLDATTRFARDGVGFSDARLWDEDGRIGRGTQSLLVAAR